MPMCEIKDHKTGETLKAYDFGGPEIYYAGTSLVYAPLGGTSVSPSEHLATLSPLGITSIMKPRWEVTGHTNVGTANWRVSVVDTSTGETKDGIYPFNLQGNVYELECQPGTWVIASCGGYKIESSWEGKKAEQVYRLKGTGEIMSIILLGSVSQFNYGTRAIYSPYNCDLLVSSNGLILGQVIDLQTSYFALKNPLPTYVCTFTNQKYLLICRLFDKDGIYFNWESCLVTTSKTYNSIEDIISDKIIYKGIDTILHHTYNQVNRYEVVNLYDY